MCECGCIGNAKRYWFPASNQGMYIISLLPACTNCDVQTGLHIELVTKEHPLWGAYKRGEFLDGPLPFEQWPDSKGVAIVTGMRRHEFIKAMLPHLVGVDSRVMGEAGVIDEAGADVIAEEMYWDAVTQPELVTDEVRDRLTKE